MEILQFLLSFFLEEYAGGKYSGIYKLLSENSFDIKKILSSIKPETVAPIIMDFFNSEKTNCPTEPVEQNFGVSPIANIADKEIIFALNKHFYA